MTTRSLFFVHIDLTELDREQTYNYTIAGIPRAVRYWTVHSNPANPDSDGDGLMDSDQIVNQWGYNIADPHPMTGDVFYDFGSDDYATRIDNKYASYPSSFYFYPGIPIDYGFLYSSFAIRQIMDDVNEVWKCGDGALVDAIKKQKPETWDNFCTMVNGHVGVFGISHNDIGQKIHYFRNRLNRAPKTLGELWAQKSDWDLLSGDKSVYHMFGDGGIYNLKFVSEDDGKYEAIYQITSNVQHFIELHQEHLLTIGFDALLWWEECSLDLSAKNMGTYNYGNPNTDPLSHALLDVIPYATETFSYGNVSYDGWGWLNVADQEWFDTASRTINEMAYNESVAAQKWHKIADEKFAR